MIGVKKLQDFSKAMIGPVLYLPAIGLLIALFSMTTNRLWVDESSGLYLVGKFVSSMLWALMTILGFCSALGWPAVWRKPARPKRPSWRP